MATRARRSQIPHWPYGPQPVGQPCSAKGLKTVLPDQPKELREGSGGEGPGAEELSVCWGLLEAARQKPRGRQRVRKGQALWNGPRTCTQPVHVRGHDNVSTVELVRTPVPKASRDGPGTRRRLSPLSRGARAGAEHRPGSTPGRGQAGLDGTENSFRPRT